MIKIYSKLLALCVFLTNFWGTTAFFVETPKTRTSVALNVLTRYGGYSGYGGYGGYGYGSDYEYGSPYRNIGIYTPYYNGYDDYYRGYGGYRGTFSVPPDGYRHRYNDYMPYMRNGMYGYNNDYVYNDYRYYDYPRRGGYGYW